MNMYVMTIAISFAVLGACVGFVLGLYVGGTKPKKNKEDGK